MLRTSISDDIMGRGNNVEQEIEGLISEGYYVEWAAHRKKLYLRVWEFDGPEPYWPKVFAEQPLVDIDELLRGIEE